MKSACTNWVRALSREDKGLFLSCRRASSTPVDYKIAHMRYELIFKRFTCWERYSSKDVQNWTNTFMSKYHLFFVDHFYHISCLYSLLKALPMTIRLTSLVPAPISYSFASLNILPTGTSFM